VEVIGHPITLFGAGHQKRGFIPLPDAMQCFALALENPPEAGEYRVFNQFADVFDLTELATRVQQAAATLSMDAGICQLENLRQELETHYCNPDHERLVELGYRPAQDIDGQLVSMLEDLRPHRTRIANKQSVLIPDIRWRGKRAKVDWH